MAGTVADPALLTEFAAAHTADFSLVTTEGSVVSGDELADSLRGAGNAVPGVRVVTAVLVPQAGARNGLRWRSVHETPRPDELARF